MATKKAQTYDPVEFLKTDEDIMAYLNAALEDGNSSLVSAALGDIARARYDPARKGDGHHARWPIQGAFTDRQPVICYGPEGDQGPRSQA